MRLSEHFTLDEMLRNSGVSTAPDHIVVNARHTAAVLEQVRRILGDVPIIPTSWYRPPNRNADTLGAAPNSAHLQGFGVDFTVPGMTSREVVARLAPQARSLGVDQLIDERDHVHLSAAPARRGEVLLEVREGEYVPYRATSAAPPSSSPSPSPPSSGTTDVRSVVFWLGIVAALIVALTEYLQRH